METFAAPEPGTFDVILMDIQMPNMDGMAVTRMIRQMNRPDAKTIPIFAMTANAFAEDVQNSKAAGTNEHLAKPLDIQKVLSMIAKYRNRAKTPLLLWQFIAEAGVFYPHTGVKRVLGRKNKRYGVFRGNVV